MRQREDKLGGLRHLADFDIARRDHAVRIGPEFGVGQGIPRRVELRLRRSHRALRRQQGFLGLVDCRTRGHLRPEQALLTVERQLRLRLLRFCGLQVGERNIEIGLLLFRIHAGKQLPGLDPCTHIHQPLGDLAADPERQVRLDPCSHFTRYDAAAIDGLLLSRDHADGAQRLFGRRLFIAAGRQGENAAKRRRDKDGFHGDLLIFASSYNI
ncbi:hypothetical protein D3C72_497330 [compost metagenome]